MSELDRSSGAVSRRIGVVFVVRIAVAVVGLVNAFLLARILEPVGKGDFYLVQLVPSTLLVLGQFGLPSAISYYAGRGQTHRLASRALVLALVLSGVGIALTAAFLPVLDATLFRAVDPALVVVSLAIVPFTYVFTFANAILTGRQAVVIYGGIALAQVVGAFVLFVVLVGIMGLGVAGAIIAYLVYQTVASIAAAIAALRVAASSSGQPPATTRDLFGYGLRLYPASLSGFFSYRLDVYLLALILADPAQLGLYSVAVGLAELAFFLPDSVVTVFFPHVAGGSRTEADRDAAVVTRVTMAATAISVVPLAIMSFVAVSIVLPAYRDSLPALYVLLPGVVMLSASKTLSAYLNGIGRGTIVSAIAVASLTCNLLLNLALIPRFGIFGAALASLASYTLGSLVQVTVCSRLTGSPRRSFLFLKADDIPVIRAGLGAMLARFRRPRSVAGS